MKKAATQNAIDLNKQCVTKFKQGRFEEAIKIGLQALKILLQTNTELHDIAICYYNLGSSYLKLYENSKNYFDPSSAKKNQHLTLAMANLEKALAVYIKLNNVEAKEKTKNKIDTCFKYKLEDQFTLTQKQVFRNRELKPIHVAVIRNDFSRVQAIYASNIKCLEECDSHGWPPVVYALFFKASVELTSFLIEKCPQLLSQKYSPLPFISAHDMRKRYTRAYGIDFNDKQERMFYEHYTKTYGSVVDDEKDFDMLAHSDSKSSNVLDEDEYYPPIYFAFVRPKMISNLIGKWSDTELFTIIKLLISIAPEQLHLLKDIEEEDDCCALLRALACKMPENVIKLLIDHTPQETLIKSGAIDIALKSNISNDIIVLLLKHTPNNVLEEKCILVNALEQHYSKNIIELLINKNPNSIKKADLGVPPLFAAIYSKADISIIEMLFEKDPGAALQLAGASILGYWDEDEWEPGYNVTSLIMALYVDRFDVAAFLLQQRPELIAIKDEHQRLPISYIDWKQVPLEFVKIFLPLSLPSLYKEENYQYTLDTLLTHNRKEIANIALKLGLAIGADLPEAITGVDTSDCIVIGLSINGKAVTRQTPGFSQSITNLEELANARNQGRILKTDEGFEYSINVVQLMLLAKAQSLQKKDTNKDSRDNKTPTNHHILVKLEKWLIVNKPTGSLTHLCLRFIRNNYTENKIKEAKEKLPEPLFKKLQL